MAKSAAADTPLMRQYAAIKERYPDAVLLFRVGDFYETFGADAVTASRVLGITLTKRNNGGSQETELAGFPHHALDNYLPKLVRAGLRVAICDQLEDPKLAKTVVKRGVTEVVTPGVAYGDRIVDHRSNNWLAALCVEQGRYGIALMDITTGEFLLGEDGPEQALRHLESHAPSELLVPRGSTDPLINRCATLFASYELDDWAFTDDMARERLLSHFGTTSLKGFGVEEARIGQRAAGAVMHYLGETCHDRLGHVNRISLLHAGAYVGLDRATMRNLEVVSSVHEGAVTLLQAMDRCTTPMGTRMLRRWLSHPLLEVKAMNDRLDRVGSLLGDDALRDDLGPLLAEVGDMERLAGKAAAGRITPRELRQLGSALTAVFRARALLVKKGGALAASTELYEPPAGLVERIEETIEPDTPATLAKGGVIRSGVHAELDELRHLNAHAKDLLLAAQQRESERTGIPSLKVGFNSVFGYYLEVRNTHKDKVPPEWVRKQTLVNAERYITAELKDLEERILGAEERILALEQELFTALVEEVCAQIAPVQQCALAMATLDVLRAFSINAQTWHYCRPTFTDGAVLDIQGGRHPVIEQQLPPGAVYVANDLLLDPATRQIVMITGPNMSGKSALLRQTALIVLMAQVGSYVPATAARIAPVDRIFTRVGASDNLTTGESTFMVEMNETASILNNLTGRSLVLLDEIGRGTSTYDGISIAWSIAEHLHDHPLRPKTLFATHYHELNEMAANHPRIQNANVAVREVDGRILFLRKLVPGGSDRSFGIQVARMAGIPPQVVARAERVLAHLERQHGGDLAADEVEGPSAPPRNTTSGLLPEAQLSIFQLDDPTLLRVREELMALDIDTLTPVEALLKLQEVQRLVGLKKGPSRKTAANV